ncbi:DUF3955 domain-containing protein [Vibrio diabolicus]|uniref:DUF3955 domain-containing protein n=1 Tax=Vibrio diabolicus TaxID=50719 RepID=UPI000B0F1136|nr:DUF3955 domain-containing protein [Vibrio diabolicus]
MGFIRKYKLSIVLFLSGVACLIAYHAQGSYVDENGLLVESFGFIPLFWLFLGVSLRLFCGHFFQTP